MTLHAYEHAAKVNPAPVHGRRHRIEHAEIDAAHGTASSSWVRDALPSAFLEREHAEVGKRSRHSRTTSITQRSPRSSDHVK